MSTKRNTDDMISSNIHRRNLIAVAVVLVTALLVTLGIVFIPKMAGTASPARPSTSSASQSSSASGVDGFPDNAGQSALDWFMGIMGKLDKTDLPQDFFSEESSADILNDMAEGKYDRIPKEIQDAFYFTDDAQQIEGRLVNYPTMKAAAITGLIIGWQTHKSTMKSDAGFKPDMSGVMVDGKHGQVVFPMETISGVPATITVAIDWNGKAWKIDGDILGSQVAAQVRSNQLQEAYTDSQSKEK